MDFIPIWKNLNYAQRILPAIRYKLCGLVRSLKITLHCRSIDWFFFDGGVGFKWVHIMNVSEVVQGRFYLVILSNEE